MKRLLFLALLTGCAHKPKLVEPIVQECVTDQERGVLACRRHNPEMWCERDLQGEFKDITFCYSFPCCPAGEITLQRKAND